jgi:hypothetical protein
MGIEPLRITLIVACIVFASLAVAKDAGTVVFVGSYEKVESSIGEHCYGYSVDIWKYNNQPFGLFHYHSGLCGDPPCGVLEAVRYDAKNGNLRFNVETRISKFQFSGALTRGALSGSLQESLAGQTSWTVHTVALPRQGTPADDEFHEMIRSLSEWHARYDSYGRCMGVAGYMKPPK